VTVAYLPLLHIVNVLLCIPCRATLLMHIILSIIAYILVVSCLSCTSNTCFFITSRFRSDPVPSCSAACVGLLARKTRREPLKSHQVYYMDAEDPKDPGDGRLKPCYCGPHCNGLQKWLPASTFYYHRDYVKQHGNDASSGLSMPKKSSKRKRGEEDRNGKRRQGENRQPVSTITAFICAIYLDDR
jgi:hypothetical protein